MGTSKKKKEKKKLDCPAVLPAIVPWSTAKPNQVRSSLTNYLSTADCHQSDATIQVWHLRLFCLLPISEGVFGWRQVKD